MQSLARPLPQPLPPPPGIVAPRDIDYPGLIELAVDATDVDRRIFQVVQTLPVSPGALTLLYPQWLPGYHSPQAPIELFAGLEITAGDRILPWRRHPTEIHAFHVDVPDGYEALKLRFQFLSPTDSKQGRVVFGPDLLNLEWNAVVLYPAGFFARRITVQPTLTLPAEWQLACALSTTERQGDVVRFESVPLDVLVDSPVFAGRYAQRVGIDERGEVSLNLFADRPDLLTATDAQLAPHRELVRQADRLFGARHFDRFEIMLALSEQIGAIGVEHHRSCEAASIPGYFADWDSNFARRDTVPHEYVHSWNGKYRRGADSWQPCFHEPIRNSLMWVYEGQTQYWDRVLCARSGMWTCDQALEAIADMAATHAIRAGSNWRPMSDTTRDPIIASRSPLPWPSWQRSEDYYTEGALVWLDVDTRLRELTNETRSLDDFARAFFGQEDGVWVTSTYTIEDVVGTLQGIAAFHWADFFEREINQTRNDAPLAGLERGGYRLVYKDHPSAYQVSKEGVTGTTNLLFSIGLMLSSGGAISEVLWDGPAFRAGLTAGGDIVAVNAREFSVDALKHAIGCAAEGVPIDLLVKAGTRTRQVTVEYHEGHRYPHLEPINGARRRLDEILAPL